MDYHPVHDTIAAKLEQLEALCRQRGVPLTIQRRTILEEVAGRDNHPTADMVFEAVQQRLPNVSRTTVYRTLETFVELGLIRRVHQTGTPARFDGRTCRHHHLLCHQCGRMIDLEAAEFDPLPLPKRPHGFRIDDYMIQVVGVCADCQKKAK